MKFLLFIVILLTVMWLIPWLILLYYYKHFDKDAAPTNKHDREDFLWLVCLPGINFLYVLVVIGYYLVKGPYLLSEWYLFGNDNSLKDKRGYRQ